MRLRRVLVTLGLALAVLATGPPASASAAGQTFTDVPPDAPFAADIEWLAAQGIAQGGADGRFRPDAPVTRQAMAVFLYHFTNQGVPVPKCATDAFTDVPTESLYCGSIAWLRDAGITRGTAAGTFRPLGPITREAMAAFLYHLEYGGSSPLECTFDAYEDVPAESSFCGSIAWLYHQGITTSSPSGSFGPTTPVTRGMMAAFLRRVATARQVPLGIDVSHPQCGRSLPAGQPFGIVGLNKGLPRFFNPCFDAQMTWAAGSSGTSQPRVQVYVNTANPGQASDVWPTSGGDGSRPCTGGLTASCAYQYGVDRALEDLARVAAPETYVWWLDVETGNSWDTGTLGQKRNVAVLEGMADTFLAAGVVDVGLYSTAYQWGRIVGPVPTGSDLVGRPSWLATGPTGVASAQRACTEAPLTSGGRVVMTQFVEGGLDRNVSCV